MGSQGCGQLRGAVGQLLCELIYVRAFSLGGGGVLLIQVINDLLRLAEAILAVHYCPQRVERFLYNLPADMFCMAIKHLKKRNYLPTLTLGRFHIKIRLSA